MKPEASAGELLLDMRGVRIEGYGEALSLIHI